MHAWVQGIVALTTGGPHCYLALPSSAHSGALRVYDAAASSANVLCEILAHKAPLVSASYMLFARLRLCMGLIVAEPRLQISLLVLPTRAAALFWSMCGVQYH